MLSRCFPRLPTRHGREHGLNQERGSLEIVETMLRGRVPDSVEVKKVKAHQQEMDDETSEEARLRVGNDSADKHAKAANGDARHDGMRKQ